MKKNYTLQLILACTTCIAGLVLLFLGFFLPPIGEIHNSVLIAFGEIATFAGSLIGIDYNYKIKQK